MVLRRQRRVTVLAEGLQSNKQPEQTPTLLNANSR